MERNFRLLAQEAWRAGKHVCVGLDVDLPRIPASVVGKSDSRILEFAQHIVDATAAVAGAYKPNAAFYEALGASGVGVLQETVEYIHRVAPSVPVILDAKRADISTSNIGTVRFLFEYLQADAATIHPYLGHEAVRPFLEQASKGIFVLCRTSNPGAGELQDLDVGGEPLFLHLAKSVERTWNERGNCGLVIGATYSQELAMVRTRVPTLPLLIPGIGAQGGDLEATVRAAHRDGRLAAFINVSRSVLYASADDDFASAARSAVEELNSEIRRVIAALG
jgi:orotidine-5'-phosphate decarboxylase